MYFKQRKFRRSVTPISDETIGRLAKVRLFDSSELNNKLCWLHKELLRYSKYKNNNQEVGILWNYVTDDYVVVKGDAIGINLRGNNNERRVYNMMAQVRKPTEQEIKLSIEREKLYDYYGIPYAIFCELNIPKNVDKDWSEAIVLISQGKPIPKDLEDRLLKYKKEKILEKVKE